MSDDNPRVRKARQADYIFWLRKDSWHPAEASILLAGYEPEAFTDGDINFSSLAGDADGIHRLIIESINAKKISVNNPPSQWIAWATQEGMTLPAELMAALSSQAGPDATPTPAAPETPAAPVVTAGASDGVKPAKAAPAKAGLLTKEIAVTFDGVNGWDVQRWRRNLSASKWLHPARTALGAAGGASSVWNPLTLAQLMHSKTKDDKAREQVMKAFNFRFTRNPVLMPWRDDFNEYFSTYCTTD